MSNRGRLACFSGRGARYVLVRACQTTHYRDFRRKPIAEHLPEIKSSPEQRLVSALGNSYGPNLAAGDDQLHLVWWDNHDANDEIYYQHSAAGGRTWTADSRLTRSPGASRFSMVAAARGNVHVVRTDERDGAAQIHYTRP